MSRKTVIEVYYDGLVQGLIASPHDLERIAPTLKGWMRASSSKAHADWYCALPWYRRWWAMVRGR
jgi:hypothetical protein